MSEIIPLLLCLEAQLSLTTLRQLRQVVFAMLCNPGRATMLGLSRWTEKGGSYPDNPTPVSHSHQLVSGALGTASDASFANRPLVLVGW